MNVLLSLELHDHSSVYVLSLLTYLVGGVWPVGLLGLLEAPKSRPRPQGTWAPPPTGVKSLPAWTWRSGRFALISSFFRLSSDRLWLSLPPQRTTAPHPCWITYNNNSKKKSLLQDKTNIFELKHCTVKIKGGYLSCLLSKAVLLDIRRR